MSLPEPDHPLMEQCLPFPLRVADLDRRDEQQLAFTHVDLAATTKGAASRGVFVLVLANAIGTKVPILNRY